MNYKYYDTPQGKDCDKKLLFSTKYAAAASAVYTFYDVLFISDIKGYGPTMARFAFNAFPFVGGAAAFTAVTCLSANVRNKDDYWNYVLGGFSAGGVMGAWRQKVAVGLGSGALLCLAGLVLHTSVVEGWDFFPKNPAPPMVSSDPTDFKNDYSFIKNDGKRNWVKQ
ncbi:NADH dehydrogenase [ubiquinone] 1 alpha subcomplex subunit 11 [Neocloeon triangulifer]|uniref:NADH dehydrogenase [ubiquinone] 1 alpha subcomplex subunit 11 n=1 Tax=Neocloeon triangulifer TaxID=2078957 RepID=UPI00286F3C87|nr:NADH dehydrogenase [ubiquinone] 1 alpha subcomplex subunit 11 [Neocloeon triangulifer]